MGFRGKISFIMIAKIAILCLVGAVSAAPKPEADPQFLAPGLGYGLGYHAPLPYVAPVVPVCRTEYEDQEVQSCAPTEEKQCKEVVDKQCAPGAVVLKKREAEAEADPQLLAAAPYAYGYGLHAPGAYASPATAVVKSACHEVVTEHCVNVPVPKEVVTPVETCHAVTKAVCTPIVNKIPKVVCETPEAPAAVAEE